MKLAELAGRLRRLNFSFKRVPKVDVVIIDSDTSEWLSQYFPKSKVLVVEIDSGYRYFWPLITCLLSGQTKIDSYIARVINCSGASLAISAQDNFLPLFKLKKRLIRAKIVLIQNGHRTTRRDLFDPDRTPARKEMKVDCFMCFNEAVGNQVVELTGSPVLAIGSFRSNHVSKGVAQSKVLSYVSTYHPEVALDFTFRTREEVAVATYKSILDHRMMILQSVVRFCELHGMTLQILGKRSCESAKLEEEYYREVLSETDFTYLSRTQPEDNYQRTDASWITVSTSSTLGYESLGRGNRTALLQSDSHLLGDSSLAIGWPTKLPQEGPFWSTSCTPARIAEVLDFLNSSTNEEWDTARQLVLKAIPEFDPGNIRFVDYLKDFGARSI